MQLVACPTCHTQYDVSDVDAKTFSCRCGAEIDNRVPKAVDAKMHRCGSCGAIVQDDTQDCDDCGSAVIRDPGSLVCPECFTRCADDARFCTACGVAFRPEEVRVEGHELPCPICDALMPPHQLGGIGVNECTRCRGLWVPGENFDSLVARTIEARRSAPPEAQLDHTLRVTAANPAHESVQYRKCPECQGFMLRRSYPKSSGVIIEACNEHGTWLDADQLEQIAGFMLSGGQTWETLAPEERSADNEFKRLRLEPQLQRAQGRRSLIRHRTPRYIGNRLRQIVHQRLHPDEPWLTADSVRILRSILKPTDVGLEWGCGRSTLWLSSHLAHLTSIENNCDWYARVQSQLNRCQISNVRLEFHETGAGRKEQKGASYVRIADRWEDASLDFVLVDGWARDACALASLDKVSPGGILIVDDAHRYLPVPGWITAPQARTGAMGPLNARWGQFLERVRSWRHIWTDDGISPTLILIRTR